MNNPPPEPDLAVSVIIPAHNAAPYLEASLAAVKADLPQNGEIILVDDCSTDDTAERAEMLGARVLRLRTNSGPSAARNLGAETAGGRVLFFVDSDVVIRPGAVSRVLSFFSDHPEYDALFGSYDDQPLAKGTVAQYRNLLHHFVHQNGNSEAATFWGACGAIRREAFLALGGFDSRSFPRCIEDIELGYRLRRSGRRIYLDKGLQCTHLKRWTLISVIRTDIFCRAVPWARLNRDRGGAPDDLNIKSSQKISVALTGLGLACLVLAWFYPLLLVPAGLALLAILGLNRDLLLFLVRKRGVWFALSCLPLHLLYFLYSGLSYAYTLLFLRLGLPVRDGNRPV
jgi:glycosyltransferase involved in cell wall biosynthesis